MSYKLIIALFFVTLFLMQGPPISAQSQPLMLNGGLQGQILSIGRDRTFRNLTVATTLTNRGKNIIYLLLLSGPHNQITAQDNAGAAFVYQSSSGGVPVCPSFDMPTCIGVPNIVQGETPPLQAWLRIDPDTSPVMLDFHLFAVTQESHGPLASFACTFAYRQVSDPGQDRILPERIKRQLINIMPFGSSTMIHVTELP